MAGSGSHASTQADARIRVAVVDDHELVRSGICNALGLAPEIKIVGEANDGAAALELLEREAVDVLLLDLHMPRLDGFGCLDAVAERWPETRVIILTVDEDPEVGLEALRRGAAAYAPKFIRPGDLAYLVRQVAGGSVLVGGSTLLGALTGVGPGPSSPAAKHSLTDRELEVLSLLAQGMSSADIARSLFVTTKTVKFHLTGIFRKLGVANRTQAAAFAINKGLVSFPAVGSEGGAPRQGPTGPAAPRPPIL